MRQLDKNSRDRLVSVAKASAGALPFIGALVAETLDAVVPNLRFERVISYLKAFEEKVVSIDSRMSYFEKNLSTEEGLDIFEEGIVQATRAISPERIKRLANLISRTLTNEKLKYAESKKLLNLFRELTDPEILWLIYHSKPPTMGSEFHKKLIEDNPDVLKPISQASNSSQEEIDKAALQDSYKNTLLRLGLFRGTELLYNITPLGNLLVRYIETRSIQSEEGLQ